MRWEPIPRDHRGDGCGPRILALAGAFILAATLTIAGWPH